MSLNKSPTAVERLDEHLTVYPHLMDRIYRNLLVALHARGLANIDDIYDQARAAAGNVNLQHEPSVNNPNVAEAPRGDQRERDWVNDITRRYAGEHLSPLEIDDLVNLTLKREEADNLRAIASLNSVSFRVLADKVRRFCALPEGETQLTPDEATGIRVGLIRHFVSDQLEFIAVAKKYLRIRDFHGMINHIIGPEAGMGRIGGKAAGMFLAAKILKAAEDRRLSVPAEAAAAPHGSAVATPSPEWPIAIPESYYLRSDVIEDFIAFNGLGEFQNQKYKSPDDIRNEYPLIKSVFRNAEFPSGVVERLRDMLLQIGTHPLIVRSSSLLEDRFGATFSGKYSSLFLPNQGRLEERLRALLGAIAEIYASALAPDPLLYRRAHDLIDYEENMAVLIQKVVGRRFGPYFAPAFAGVLFSLNEYRWSPRIRREDGLLRVVMGLGTRAVDRVGKESPRMVALGMPTLRPESSMAEIMRRSQRTVDVINLERNRLESITLDRLLEHAADVPMLDQLVSVRREGMLLPPMGTYIDADPSDLYVTFDKLLAEGSLPVQMRGMLRRLETSYGLPVDVEFAHDGERLYILQCRALARPKEIANVSIPADVPAADVVFSARQFVRSALVDAVRYIVNVDSRAYDAVPTRQERIGVARVVGRLNERLAGQSFILIGPGRWGSNDIRLGVPVTYADISNTRMLIEVARERGGYVPEVSYGTHFFQDLVEADIAYLPLYPDDPRNQFNEGILRETPNCLGSLSPADAASGYVVHVTDVPAVTGGRTVRVVMDGRVDQALAYLVDAGGTAIR